MIPFIKSSEFWVSNVLIATLVYVCGIDRLSSIIQVLGFYGIVYSVYRIHRHHEILKVLMGGETDGRD